MIDLTVAERMERKYAVGDLVWIFRGPGTLPVASRKKPGVVLAVRGGKYPYRVRYEQRTRPPQEAWAWPGDIMPRELPKTCECGAVGPDGTFGSGNGRSEHANWCGVWKVVA